MDGVLCGLADATDDDVGRLRFCSSRDLNFAWAAVVTQSDFMSLIRLAFTVGFGILCACSGDSGTGAGRQVLTARGLDSGDEFFVFELADRVAEHVDIDDTPESVERLRALPEHWRYIEPLIYYFNEVNNGGHHQYFWNSQGVYRHLVAEGLKYYQATEFEKNFADALAVYRPEAYEVGKGGTWEAFQEAYKEDRYDKQDSRFYQIKPKLSVILAKAVLERIDQYQ
ncbi:MAG: DUF4375 domain-containing protein [Prosthecobacter sp.]|nr:DUF4375 domain-containing protein [Prosthecobacter sp.]